MAAADPRTVEKIAVQLAINPTTDPPIDVFPHGGTALGMAADVIWRPNLRRGIIRGEEYGGEPVEVLLMAQTAVLGVLLRGGDNDAYSTIFDDTTVGASGVTGVDHPGTRRAGERGSDRTVALILSPFDTVNHRALLIYQAIPLLEETAELRFALKQEQVVPAIFMATRDSTDRIWSYRPLEDLSL